MQSNFKHVEILEAQTENHVGRAILGSSEIQRNGCFILALSLGAQNHHKYLLHKTKA
jgi:hypothetical protein